MDWNTGMHFHPRGKYYISLMWCWDCICKMPALKLSLLSSKFSQLLIHQTAAVALAKIAAKLSTSQNSQEMSARGLSYVRTGCSLGQTRRNTVSSGTTEKEKLVLEFNMKNDSPSSHPCQRHSLLFITRNSVCVKTKVDWKGYQSTHRDNNSEN